ncbi:MAG: cyanophycin synthetase [Lacunisphaera sp.]
MDESDGTIDRFSPEITVVVNLDWDHADRYARLADLEAAFAALLARTKGAVFVSDVCAQSARIVARGGAAPVFTFGRTGNFQYNLLSDTTAGQELALSGRFEIPRVRVPAHGEFNAINAAAALAVAQYIGAAVDAGSLTCFAGVRRRQSVLHASTVRIYEDYAHHPTEIRALLKSLRSGLVGGSPLAATSGVRSAQAPILHRTGGRLVVVFQPHRYTRTAQFKAEFAAALAAADLLFLMDVYAASESPVAGGTSADIYAELKKSGAADHVTYLPGDDEGLLKALGAALQTGDTLAFVGAGDIEQAAREFVTRRKAVEQREAAWNDFLTAARPRISAATKLVEREILAQKTTMRVGGPARVYAEPASMEDLQHLLIEARRRALPVLLLGRGSNLIIPDEGVDGLVINLGHENWQKFEPHPDGRVWAGPDCG